MATGLTGMSGVLFLQFLRLTYLFHLRTKYYRVALSLPRVHPPVQRMSWPTLQPPHNSSCHDTIRLARLSLPHPAHPFSPVGRPRSRDVRVLAGVCP
ncbi:hypothetical protein EDB85DRAFT_1953605 [Lactarius pseudohatsudake]|nr:hypothetical protein EDB85DRAFT_1953605 [Lactarius pseudohatsudake]